VVDSTPVECGRFRQTVKRSDLAGWTQYGYCASHSRYFWGLRLHLVCTLSGAKADERETLLDIFATEPELASTRPGVALIGDKNYFGREFEAKLAGMHIELLRPARKGEAERAGSHLFKPLRQVIESINETFKGQLDLERHHGRIVLPVMGRRFAGLYLDFVGVLTSNMVEVIDLFEVRERMPAGRFLRAWASREGQDLYRRLELGEIRCPAPPAAATQATCR
jgi:hypothetical protein